MISKSLLEKEISTLEKRLEEKRNELQRIDEIEYNNMLEAAEKTYLGKSFKISEGQGCVTYLGCVSKIEEVSEEKTVVLAWKLIKVIYNAMGSYDIHIENATSLKKFTIRKTMSVYELSDKEFDGVVTDRIKSAINSYLN